MRKECMYEKFYRKLHSESGAAVVLALSVILVLTALGIVAITSSVANVSMSRKTRRWSEDFYRLDAKAAEYERIIDSELVQAEKDAREYVKNRMDRLDPSSLTGDYITVYHMADSGVQDFFRAYYQVDWTYIDPITGDLKEYSVGDYLNYPRSQIAEISTWYEDWHIDNPYTPAPDADNDVAKAYSNDVTNYASDLFDRVYFFMLSVRLEKLSPMYPAGDIVLKENASSPVGAYYGVVYNNPDFFCTYKYKNIGGVPAGGATAIKQKWKDIEPNDTDIGIYIRVDQASLNEPGNPLDNLKNVHVYMSITRLDYDVVLKHVYTPVLGNPIWTNALSAEGGIRFDNSAHVNITGDVYSASVSEGISVRSGAQVSIKGNVYSAGNLGIVGNGGRLSVTQNTLTYTAKKAIYENDLLFENFFLLSADPGQAGFGNQLKNYTYTTMDPDPSNIGKMPFIYLDAADKGNVYCNDLLVDSSVSGALIQIERNVWTKDDIQIDGMNSTIQIGNASGNTYYVGLNPFSSENDPNESSAIINNYPYEGSGSKIVLNSKFFIPGVAYYEFGSGPSDPLIPDSFEKYYKSLESIASRTNNPFPIMSAYTFRRGYPPISEGVIYRQGSDSFELFPTTDESVRRQAFNDYIEGEGGIKTNVVTDLPFGTGAVDGFVAEVALIQHDVDGDSNYEDATFYTISPNPAGVGVKLPNSGDNYSQYGNFVYGSYHFLMDIFESKTRKLGTGEADGGFEYFVEKTNTGLINSLRNTGDLIVPSSNTIDINTLPEKGIVYHNGNLNIINSGASTKTFRGTVICTGSITVGNNVNITYDENVIIDKLKYSQQLREFFEKGNRGVKIDDCEEYSTSSGGRTIVIKRYKIKEWSEVAIPS